MEERMTSFPRNVDQSVREVSGNKQFKHPLRHVRFPLLPFSGANRASTDAFQWGMEKKMGWF